MELTSLGQYTQQPKKKNRTISGSLPGMPNPSIFPSKDNFAHNTMRVIVRSKGIGWQNKNVIAECVFCKDIFFSLKIFNRSRKYISRSDIY
jgi:hypothetical protein